MSLRLAVCSFKYDCGQIGWFSPVHSLVWNLLFQNKVNIRYSCVLLFVANATEGTEGNWVC